MFHPKVTAAAAAAAVSVMVVAELKRRGVEIDATEAASLTTLISVLTGFMMPSDTPAGIVEVPVALNAPPTEMQGGVVRAPAEPPLPPRVVPPPLAPLEPPPP